VRREKIEVDLGEDVEEFLRALDPHTARVYRVGLSLFGEYYGRPISQFLDEVDEDLRRPRRERQRIGEKAMRGFVEWLSSRGYAPKTVRAYLAALQSLARYYEIPLSARYVNAPAPRPVHRKFPWTLEKVGRFVDCFDRADAKALAAFLFQSGLSLSDALALTYGDVKDEYEAGVVPMCIDLVRIKTDTPHMTFVGDYALSLLREYLRSRRPKPDEPLFRIPRRTVDHCFEVAAKKFLRGFTGRNPCSAHSLRAAFRTLLRDANCPEEYVEFWMGHNVFGDIRKVYTMHSREGWRREYAKYEKYLDPRSVS
jgi:integrase